MVIQYDMIRNDLTWYDLLAGWRSLYVAKKMWLKCITMEISMLKWLEDDQTTWNECYKLIANEMIH